MNKYKCKFCDYIYDPEIGAPEAGVPPGTPFEDLPELWICPLCGANTSSFVVIQEIAMGFKLIAIELFGLLLC